MSFPGNRWGGKKKKKGDFGSGKKSTPTNPRKAKSSRWRGEKVSLVLTTHARKDAGEGLTY